MKNDVRLSPMKEADLELVMSWRSHPDAFKFFKKQTKPLIWSEHYSFWKNRKNRLDYIIELKEDGNWRKVGNLNFSKLESEMPEIGIIIGETSLKGKGVGSLAIKLGLNKLFKLHYLKCQVNININNVASVKLFSKFGFKKDAFNKNNIWHKYILERQSI